MQSSFDSEQWAVGTTRGRHVFNYCYRMLGRELTGWVLLKAVSMEQTRELSEDVYLWQSKKDPSRETIRVSIAELDDWRLAQRRLLTTLTHCMRPNIPRGTGAIGEVGDVNFVGRDPQSDAPAAIFFTRGNVCLAVNSVGSLSTDVSKIARSVDRALSEPPVKTRTRIQKRVLVVKPEQSYPLIKNLRKAAPRGGWLKVIAPDGELARKGNSLIYASPHGGKKEIGIYATPGEQVGS
jgi:hypothetical protein